MNLEMPVFGSAEFVIRRGAIEYLTQMGKKRIALLIGSSSRGPRLERIEKLLDDHGIEHELIGVFHGEPLMQDLEEPIRRIQEYQPDCIVAVGGGAIMDTGKALWIFLEHPEMTWEDAFKYFQIPPLGKKASLVMVPTTSGTGSETTFVAVFTDAKTKQKNLIMSREIIPDVAILDADFVDSLPDIVAVHTGLDALTQALEGAICAASSPMCSSIGIAAAEDIFEWLPYSVKPDTDPAKKAEARERMHIAASQAGMVIANTCCGLAHAFDQPGPYFGIPHGLVCGIFLPYTIKYTLPNKVLMRLATHLNFTGTEEEKGRQLVEYIRAFNREVGIQDGFKDLGVDRDEYLRKLDDFLDLAEASISTKLSPKVPNRDEIRQIFMDAYEGAPLYE